MQFFVASIFTRPWCEISTVVSLFSSAGRGCFQGSPSIRMYVQSAAPLWNSNLTRCV
ncbi:hypothetical protein Hanom_Chr05g00416841 [Helianthus anomalus]